MWLQIYCDRDGNPLEALPEEEQKQLEADLDNKMRLFYRSKSRHTQM